eukprot:2565217-Rhodomonas_salina.1
MASVRVLRRVLSSVPLRSAVSYMYRNGAPPLCEVRATSEEKGQSSKTTQNTDLDALDNVELAAGVRFNGTAGGLRQRFVQRRQRLQLLLPRRVHRVRRLALKSRARDRQEPREGAQCNKESRAARRVEERRKRERERRESGSAPWEQRESRTAGSGGACARARREGRASQACRGQRAWRES